MYSTPNIFQNTHSINYCDCNCIQMIKVWFLFFWNKILTISLFKDLISYTLLYIEKSNMHREINPFLFELILFISLEMLHPFKVDLLNNHGHLNLRHFNPFWPSSINPNFSW